MIKENYIRNGSSGAAERFESAKNKAHAARKNHSPPWKPAGNSRKQVKMLKKIIIIKTLAALTITNNECVSIIVLVRAGKSNFTTHCCHHC